MPRVPAFAWLCVFGLGLVTGCECGSTALTEPVEDASLDASDDDASTMDAGDDAGMDAGNDASMLTCEPESTRECYTGPPGTVNVGECIVGIETCNAEGSDWGACMGEVVPAMEEATEPGQTPADEDCDGLVDEAP